MGTFCVYNCLLYVEIFPFRKEEADDESVVQSKAGISFTVVRRHSVDWLATIFAKWILDSFYACSLD